MLEELHVTMAFDVSFWQRDKSERQECKLDVDL